MNTARLTDLRLSHGSLLERVLDVAGRAAARLRLFRAADSRVEVLELPGHDLVLTPLAGSSPIRLNSAAPVRYSTRGTVPILMLWRDDAERVQSFYNKRLRNADTVGKALMLASTPSLDRGMTTEAFIDVWIGELGRADKDKHLKSNAEILATLELDECGVEKVGLTEDRARLEGLTGLSLERRVNASADVATRYPPTVFDTAQRTRITEATR